jgi:hypothetical protein
MGRVPLFSVHVNGESIGDFCESEALNRAKTNWRPGRNVTMRDLWTGKTYRY